ncbi:hypothetical protein, partial [Isoptericola halotolerans]
GPEARARVLDPLGRDGDVPRPGRPAPLLLPELVPGLPGGPTAGRPGSPARQVDATTCGAAVLVMLRLAGDAASALALAVDPRGAWEAFARRQREVHARARRLWPGRLGTPPWGAAREARYGPLRGKRPGAGPVRYTHRVVRRSEPPEGPRSVLAAALASAGAGIPVPLYTGGDLRGGVSTAVPRHVVLLTAVRPTDAGPVATVYEPSSGALHAVPVDALRAPGTDDADRVARRRALGGWPHVVWALLPREERGSGTAWGT